AGKRPVSAAAKMIYCPGTPPPARGAAMTSLTLVLLAALPAAGRKAPAKPAAPPARVTVTAETACLHCTFGEGEHCALCLKLDDKMPVLLDGKAAKPFFASRLDGKVVVA